MQILLIEHQDAYSDQFAAAFGHTSHHIILAKKSADGLRMARQQRPSIILSALSSPSNGMEVFLTVRTDKTFDGTPFVAFTSFASPEDRRHLLALGFSGVITKPVPRDLVAQVEGYIGKTAIG